MKKSSFAELTPRHVDFLRGFSQIVSRNSRRWHSFIRWQSALSHYCQKQDFAICQTPLQSVLNNPPSNDFHFNFKDRFAGGMLGAVSTICVFRRNSLRQNIFQDRIGGVILVTFWRRRCRWSSSKPKSWIHGFGPNSRIINSSKACE